MAGSSEHQQDKGAELPRAAAFAAVEDRLRKILDPLRSRLVATRDRPGDLALEIPGLEGKPWGYVAGIRRGKRYVSYYLMAAYADPEVTASMSPELRRRMQGKSCFNFTHVDEPLFDELARITETTFEPQVAYAKQVDAARSPTKSR
jgi:hypothetical protein